MSQPSKKNRIYRIWGAMKNRCSNPNHKDYKYYGRRGITVCEEWRISFKAFEQWALCHNYSDLLTIDRINNDDNYYPDNCRWATMREQNKNKKLKYEMSCKIRRGCRPIKQINQNGEIVKVFNSVRDAKRQGFNIGAIWKCCTNKIKNHKGFKWGYIE